MPLSLPAVPPPPAVLLPACPPRFRIQVLRWAARRGRAAAGAAREDADFAKRGAAAAGPAGTRAPRSAAGERGPRMPVPAQEMPAGNRGESGRPGPASRRKLQTDPERREARGSPGGSLRGQRRGRSRASAGAAVRGGPHAGEESCPCGARRTPGVRAVEAQRKAGGFQAVPWACPGASWALWARRLASRACFMMGP